MALLGLFNVHRHGSLNTAAFLLYALTSCVSGYVSAKHYKQMNGERWVWNINLTASLYTIPFFITWSIINSLAWAKGKLRIKFMNTIFSNNESLQEAHKLCHLQLLSYLCWYGL